MVMAVGWENRRQASKSNYGYRINDMLLNIGFAESIEWIFVKSTLMCLVALGVVLMYLCMDHHPLKSDSRRVFPATADSQT